MFPRCHNLFAVCYLPQTQLAVKRLKTSRKLAFQDGSAASAGSVAANTKTAFDFVETAFDVIGKLPF
jgi:hypothetical protein